MGPGRGSFSQEAMQRASRKELAKGLQAEGRTRRPEVTGRLWRTPKSPEGLEQRAGPRRDSDGRQGPGHEEPACPRAKKRGDGGSRDKAGGRRRGLGLRG